MKTFKHFHYFNVNNNLNLYANNVIIDKYHIIQVSNQLLNETIATIESNTSKIHNFLSLTVI